MDYPEIGEQSDKRPAAFTLDILTHVPIVNPDDYNLPCDTPKINPEDYFVTSGDAVEKAKYMAQQIRKLSKSVTHTGYAAALSVMADNADYLIEKLITARGPDCFLETEWCGGHILIVIPKNPRAAKILNDQV